MGLTFCTDGIQSFTASKITSSSAHRIITLCNKNLLVPIAIEGKKTKIFSPQQVMLIKTLHELAQVYPSPELFRMPALFDLELYSYKKLKCSRCLVSEYKKGKLLKRDFLFDVKDFTFENWRKQPLSSIHLCHLPIFLDSIESVIQKAETLGYEASAQCLIEYYYQ